LPPRRPRASALPSDHDDDDAALLGGVPLMLSHGTGSELRRLADRLGRRQPLLALRQPLGYTMAALSSVKR
jgi:hypothetical protein